MEWINDDTFILLLLLLGVCLYVRSLFENNKVCHVVCVDGLSRLKFVELKSVTKRKRQHTTMTNNNNERK